MSTSPAIPAEIVSTGSVAFDERPPGERYFRHPGDVLRLVLWGAATALLVVFIEIGTETNDGFRSDLGNATDRLPTSLRELMLALTQVGAIAAPIVVATVLVAQQRWRRLGFVAFAAVVGVGVWWVFDVALDLQRRLSTAVDSGTWIASARFPSLGYVAAAAAAGTVCKPWLSRSWRRSTDLGLALFLVVLAIAGTAGASELALALAVGATVGTALLVLFGAPNRRPAPAAVAIALGDAGLDVVRLRLQRAEEGRSQLYTAQLAGGDDVFVKVYGRDSRDADFLFRAYRRVMLRGIDDDWPPPSLKSGVEHEAFLLLLARRGGVTCPEVRALASLDDGSMALALEYEQGRPLDTLAPEEIGADLLDAIWREVATMHAQRVAHRSLRARNILVADQRPVIIDLGFGEESATARMQVLDRAELLASLAALTGVGPAVDSAARVLGAAVLAGVVPFLQPLALTAATRKQTSKSLLSDLRARIADVSGEEPEPLERLVRVRPRTLLMIAALAAAFYVLLPQLANVGDSFRALRSANWAWLVLAIAMSLLTYVASAVGNAGGVRERIPFGPNVEAQVASSFVNRIAPANVAGMALNVRFLRKAGVQPAEAVTGVGLNSIVGAIVHVVLLIVFFTWAGQATGKAFKLPASSKTLVIIAVLFAIAGIVIATRRGRRMVRVHMLGFLKQSWTSLMNLAHSPRKLAALFAGSLGVTLAYIAAFAAAVSAYEGNISIARIGAVYLGGSLIAAAAPTPGGLGALEAALVAGLTGINVEPGTAVAAVLSYRLATYWLPILPGWLAFHHLDRNGYI